MSEDDLCPICNSELEMACACEFARPLQTKDYRIFYWRYGDYMGDADGVYLITVVEHYHPLVGKYEQQTKRKLLEPAACTPALIAKLEKLLVLL